MAKYNIFIVGNPETINKVKIISKAKRRYRIIIQEKPIKGNKNEKCRSFMIKDYVGNTDIDKIKNKLMKISFTDSIVKKKKKRTWLSYLTW